MSPELLRGVDPNVLIKRYERGMSIEQIARSENLEEAIVAELVSDTSQNERGPSSTKAAPIEKPQPRTPGRERTPIDYKHVEKLLKQGYTLKYIATMLEISYKTLHNRISRDRPDLKKSNLK